MKPKYGYNQQVELNGIAKERFKNFNSIKGFKIGKIVDVTYISWLGYVYTVECAEDTKTIFLHEKYLRKKETWMTGFTIEPSTYDELDKSQLDAIRELRSRASQGKSTKRVMS